MDCPNCEAKQRPLLCTNCINAYLRDVHAKHQRATDERDEQVRRATAALEFVGEARKRRATLQEHQTRLEEMKEGLARLREHNDALRKRLAILRDALPARRRTLAQARLLSPPHVEPAQALAREGRILAQLADTLARARAGLVTELVEVFNVVEVGGRPPVGGKAGTKGEWTIGGLVLPVLGDIRRYPPDHINAVITHTVHFVGLLAFYLGVKLPFDVTWSGGKLGVGQAWIRAIKGGESGSWAKWTSKQCLHVSPTPVSPPPSSPQDAVSPSVPPLEQSYIEAPAPAAGFTTAYAMMLFDVCYIAHTQAVDVPLAGAGDVLSNLWMVCCSGELGRRSHATHPLLPPPTPPSFPLDFSQLLQATTAKPARPRRLRKQQQPREAPVEEEGWEVVEEGDV
ncbi:UV radiation resistance protein/autophagy-related protein 14 [Vararia minispora EC-137]|uniref:UV radiation resistance protein/autophagy-related protein 14 n=1 Tax=Vararia minispora EC-137 TaxID=1314806 RepID=A0ACB8QY95_9AGAM|nr:UV radiation resistance protein/autophagy-related protein 14 [Vararia minispora EC-137]